MNIFNILGNHWQYLYKIKPLSDYTRFTYYDALSLCSVGGLTESERNNRGNASNQSRSIGRQNNQRNISDIVNKFNGFLNETDENNVTNLSKLGWDLNDLTTWEGVTFNNSGDITGINLEFLDLYGSLDLSNLTQLETVNVSANYIDSVNISGCSSLESLDVSDNDLECINLSTNTNLLSLNCSFNPISQIDLSSNDLITDLSVSACQLTQLNISNLNDLVTLDCISNNLSSLNVSNCANLAELYCMMNYLDVNDTSLQQQFSNVLNNSDGTVVSEPQLLPDNASFDNNELQKIISFANQNEDLELLDENDNINIENLQNYFGFKKYNGVYRVEEICLTDGSITGTLNCSEFNYLKSVYIPKTKISSINLTNCTSLKNLYSDNTNLSELNLYNCTNLEVLECQYSDIETLTLPSNITNSNSPLYQIDCEYNHIDTSVFTQSIIDSIEAKTDYVLEYENQKYEDSSALEAALEFAGTLRSSDYSEESFTVLSDLVVEYSDFENMLLTQDDVNEMTAEILTAISDLVPYLKLRTVYENGTVSITKDSQPVSTKYTSALSGTPITLTATPEEGYIFNGWYELTAKRIFSTSSTYSFNLTTNLSFEAQFVPTGSATLTFTNDTGQIVDTVTKTAQEWANTPSLTDLLPEVPYKLGHTGGQWSYVESDILYALASGTDSYISPTYNTSSFVYPEIPTPVNNKPVSTLTFSYNADEDIGSYIMAAGIPQNLDVEAIGIAFYKKSRENFNPDTYILNLSNKSLVSRFDGRESDGLYIVNVHGFAVKNNWCARGFITYRDGDELITHYTNQINTTTSNTNNNRGAVSRSLIINDSDDADNDNNGGGIDHDFDPDPL